MSSVEADNNRVYWHSRRGMLELDLVLMPFAKDCYPGLDPAEQALYRRLLESEDQDMFGWFMGHNEPEDAEFARMVRFILEWNAKRLAST